MSLPSDSAKNFLAVSSEFFSSSKDFQCEVAGLYGHLGSVGKVLLCIVMLGGKHLGLMLKDPFLDASLGLCKDVLSEPSSEWIYAEIPLKALPSVEWLVLNHVRPNKHRRTMQFWLISFLCHRLHPL